MRDPAPIPQLGRGRGLSGAGTGRGQKAQARSAGPDQGTWKEEGPRGGAWGGAWGGDMVRECGWGQQGPSGPGSEEGPGWARVTRTGLVGMGKLQGGHCGVGA